MSVRFEQSGVVELGLVREHVAVRVRCDGEVPLADVFADLRAWNPARWRRGIWRWRRSWARTPAHVQRCRRG
jgi:hypothetical protein